MDLDDMRREPAVRASTASRPALRRRTTAVTTALMAALLLSTGCGAQAESSPAAAETAPAAARTAAPAGSEVLDDIPLDDPARLDLTDERVLRAVCGITEDALRNTHLESGASLTVPDYWVAEGFPVPEIEHPVFCTQRLLTNDVVTTWVMLRDATANFPIAEQWIAGVEDAGYSHRDGSDAELIRQVAQGEVSGLGDGKWWADERPYLAGVRAYGTGSIMLLIQTKP